MASPYTLEDPIDPQRDLLKPTVQDTLNVLIAARHMGVKRVVLTSSISVMVVTSPIMKAARKEKKNSTEFWRRVMTTSPLQIPGLDNPATILHETRCVLT